MAFKGSTVKAIAQYRSHGAIDALQARLVDHLIVASFGTQRSLVNVHNHHRAFIDMQPLTQDPLHPITDGGPTVCAVDAAIIDLGHWGIIGLFAPNKTRACPLG